MWTGPRVDIIGNQEGSSAKFREVAVDPSQFTSIESKIARSVNICALYCRFVV